MSSDTNKWASGPAGRDHPLLIHTPFQVLQGDPVDEGGRVAVGDLGQGERLGATERFGFGCVHGRRF